MEDLCETLSLAHDLGHTLFGHAGEEALNECMKKMVVLITIYKHFNCIIFRKINIIIFMD